jgi:hypothetical protein
MNIRAELQPDGYWQAVDEDTFDVQFQTASNHTIYFSRSAVGVGLTEQEAILDLREQLEQEGKT